MTSRVRTAVWLAGAAAAAMTVAARPADTTGHLAPQAVVVNQGPPIPLGAEPILGTGIVSGVVIDAQTEAPIPGAVVSLALGGTRGLPGQQSRQVTDSRGRFVFVQVPASDRLAVRASRAGYLPGDDRFGSTLGQLALADGQWLSDVRIELSKLGSIGGTVLDERGEPVVGVYVRALAVARIAGRQRLAAGPMTRTDDRGQYRVADLMPGRYQVLVPSVQAAVPAAASSAEIAGWTEDRLAAARSRGATPQIPVEKAVPAGDAARVVVGPYPIPPPVSGGRALAYPMTFYPGVASLGEATIVDVKLGEQRAGLDIRLTPLPVVQVSGRVDAPPEARAGLNLRLLASGLEELGLGSETATALVGQDGTFRFANIPAGTYTIEAPVSVNEYRYSQLTPFGPMIGRPPGVSGTGSWSGDIGWGPPGGGFTSTTLDGARSMSGRVTVIVGDAAVRDVEIVLRPTARITGRIAFEFDPNREQPAQLPGVQVVAEPVDASPALGMPRALADRNDPSRPFELTGLLPGRYMLRASTASTWTIKAITLDGRDHTSVPFDTTTASAFDGVVVTVTNAVARVTGSVRDARGGPAVRARVIAFPANRAQWTLPGINPPNVRSVVTNNLGAFELGSLPAGDYYVMALADARWGDWRDPAFFERAVASAERVSLAWGATIARDLIAVEVPR